jgi:hypothetical protein
MNLLLMQLSLLLSHFRSKYSRQYCASECSNSATVQNDRHCYVLRALIFRFVDGTIHDSELNYTKHFPYFVFSLRFLCSIILFTE